MFKFNFVLLVFFIRATQPAVNSCSSQSKCLDVTLEPSNPEGCAAGVECYDVCMQWNGDDIDTCQKDPPDTISHSCVMEAFGGDMIGEKTDPWHAGWDICEENVPCGTEVYFVVKDGPNGCADDDIADSFRELHGDIAQCKMEQKCVQTSSAIGCGWTVTPPCSASEPEPTGGKGGPLDTCDKQSKCINFETRSSGVDGSYQFCLNWDRTDDECTKEGDISYAEACDCDLDVCKIEGFDVYGVNNDEVCHTVPCDEADEWYYFQVKDGNCDGEAIFDDDDTMTCAPQEGNQCPDRDENPERRRLPGKGNNDKIKTTRQPKPNGKGNGNGNKGPCAWAVRPPGCHEDGTPKEPLNPSDVAFALMDTKDAVNDKDALVALDADGSVNSVFVVVVVAIVLGSLLAIGLAVLFYVKVIKTERNEKVADEEDIKVDVVVAEGVDENEEEETVAVTQTTD